MRKLKYVLDRVLENPQIVDNEIHNKNDDWEVRIRSNVPFDLLAKKIQDLLLYPKLWRFSYTKGFIIAKFKNSDFQIEAKIRKKMKIKRRKNA